MFHQTLTPIIGIDLGLNKSVLAIFTPHDPGCSIEYLAQTEAEFEAQHHERQEKNLHRKAKQFGYRLEKIEPPTPDPEAEAK